VRSHAPLDPLTELLLFNAARAELIARVIRPALESGRFVLCDRFTGSTCAYQGYGRGLALDLVRRVNDVAAGGLAPDLAVFLDLPVEDGLARKRGGDDDEYIGAEDTAFHERVRRGFRELAATEGWLTIDARQPADEVFEAARAAIRGYVPAG
jgi:dTMP kinase